MVLCQCAANIGFYRTAALPRAGFPHSLDRDRKTIAWNQDIIIVNGKIQYTKFGYVWRR